MQKKILQRKSKALIEIQSAVEMGGLSVAFLRAFGYQLESQIHNVFHLKRALISASTQLDRYQAWRRINDTYQDLLVRSPQMLEEMKERGVDLKSLSRAYLKPDNLGVEQKEQWTQGGEEFIKGSLSNEYVQQIRDIESQIQKILVTDKVSSEIKKIETDLVSPLMSQARDAIERISSGDSDPKLESQIDEIKGRIESIYKNKIDPVITAAQTSDEISPQDKLKVIELKNKKMAIGSLMMANLYKSLLDESDIDDDSASAWANAQEITDSAAARMRKIGYTKSELKRDLASYYKLVNGRIDEVRIVTTGSNRASAVLNTSTIDIDGNFDKTTLFHEMSHLLERDELVKESNQEFIRNRATGEAEQLRVLTNNYQYSSDEIALPDHFFSPYVGKLYASGATEVAAMGIQQFSSPQKMYHLYDADPEMFSMMVGMILGMTDTQKLRQHEMLRERLLTASFYEKLNKKLPSMSWVAGHAMSSDEEYSRYLDPMQVGSKNVSYTKKWLWKETLGECVLRPAKAKGKRQQFYVVEMSDGNRQYFPQKLLAQAYCYLFEVSKLNGNPDRDTAFTIASRKLCPLWYEGGDIPII